MGGAGSRRRLGRRMGALWNERSRVAAVGVRDRLSASGAHRFGSRRLRKAAARTRTKRTRDARRPERRKTNPGRERKTGEGEKVTLLRFASELFRRLRLLVSQRFLRRGKLPLHAVLPRRGVNKRIWIAGFARLQQCRALMKTAALVAIWGLP